jgi:hypothetical protein
VGVQFVGRRLQEEKMLTLAEYLGDEISKTAETTLMLEMTVTIKCLYHESGDIKCSERKFHSSALHCAIFNTGWKRGRTS